MREEVSRLETKEFLTDDEHKRYRALKFELEYRRRLHSLNSDNGGGPSEEPNGVTSSASMMKVENEFDEILRSLAPFSSVTPREIPAEVSEWRHR